MIAIGFVLDVWVASHLDATRLTRPLGVAVAVGIVTTLVGVALLRDRYRGGLVGGFAIIAIIGGDDIRVVLLALGGIGAVAMLGRREIAPWPSIPWRRVTVVFNAITTVTVMILASQALWLALRMPQPLPESTGRPAVIRTYPDIVVLLLDGHGRADVLWENYGEDISAFQQALIVRGFEVSSRSRSNYMTTELTLASMLNLSHLTDLAVPRLTDPDHDFAVKELINVNSAFRMLRSFGYRIASVSSGWEGAALRSGDVFIERGQATDFEHVLIANTIVVRALDVAAPDLLAAQLRDRVRWNLNPANWLPAMSDGPDFMFVHVPSPHPPYVFKRDGGPNPNRVIYTGAAAKLELNEATRPGAARAYADQLAYIDALTISAIDQLLVKVPSDTVVIVMSDHGPDVYLDWRNLTTTNTRGRFANLFAARTPGAPGLFRDSPTLVNLFTTLFNAYAGTTLPSRSDSSFIGSPSHQDLIDIGDPDADS